MTLEEIDFLFTNPDKGPVELSKKLAKGRKKHRHVSIVADTGIMKHVNVSGQASQDKIGTEEEHIENN